MLFGNIDGEDDLKPLLFLALCRLPPALRPCEGQNHDGGASACRAIFNFRFGHEGGDCAEKVRWARKVRVLNLSPAPFSLARNNCETQKEHSES